MLDTKELIKLVPNNWTMQQLVQKVYGEGNTSGIDYAIPQPVADNLRQLGMDLTYFVYSYKEEDNGGNFGRLVNLAEKLLAKQGEVYDEVVHEYLSKCTERQLEKSIENGEVDD